MLSAKSPRSQWRSSPVLMVLAAVVSVALGLRTSGGHYAVKFSSGDISPTEFAARHGLEDLGQVLPGSGIHHFALKHGGRRRSKRSVEEVKLALEAAPESEWVQEQTPLKRTKRQGGADAAVVHPACIVTTLGSPTKGPKRCVFPFTFKGARYLSCTKDHSSNGKEWCATQVEAGGEVVVGQWGDCDPSSLNRCLPAGDGLGPRAGHFSDAAAGGDFSGVGAPFGFGPQGFSAPRGPAAPLPPFFARRPPLFGQGTPQVDRSFLDFLNTLGSSQPNLLLENEGGGLLGSSSSSSDLRGEFEDDRGSSNTPQEALRTRLNDPMWPKMWFLNRGVDAETGNALDMNVEDAWEQGFTGKGVVVSILDDGVEWDHPDLQGNYDPEASTDLNNNDRDPYPRYDRLDSNKHGTRCAGQVAAVANNSICSVGIAHGAKIGGVRVLDGPIFDALEAKALSFNRDHIDIYSASWGPDDDGKTIDGPGVLSAMALADGVKKGRRGLGSIFVWASGNGGKAQDNCNADGYTTSPYTLSVSSSTESGAIPWYSEPCASTLTTTYSSGSVGDGPRQDGRAGDRKVVTTDLRGGCTGRHTGTSASSPMAAAIVAMGLEANGNLTWRDVQHLVVRTSRPLGNLKASDWAKNGAGLLYSHSFGFGLMDAGELVRQARTWRTVPEQLASKVHAAPKDGQAEILPGQEGRFGFEVDKESAGGVRFMEHLHLVVQLNTLARRGDLSVQLESPSGTVSTLFGPRPLDDVRTGLGLLARWPMMSTHFWGEDPSGEWSLIVRNYGDRPATLQDWDVVLYGTREDPQPGSPLKPNLPNNQTRSDDDDDDVNDGGNDDGDENGDARGLAGEEQEEIAVTQEPTSTLPSTGPV